MEIILRKSKKALCGKIKLKSFLISGLWADFRNIEKQLKVENKDHHAKLCGSQNISTFLQRFFMIKIFERATKRNEYDTKNRISYWYYIRICDQRPNQ